MAQKLDPKDFMFTDLNGQHLEKRPGSINGTQFIVQNLDDCTVHLLDHTGPVNIDDCKNCRFVIGPSNGAVFLRDCSDCTFTVACRQFRTRDLNNCTIFLYSLTEPIVELTSNAKFSIWNAAYPGLTQMFGAANLEPNKNLWDKIYDFNEKDDSVPRPHWEKLDSAGFEMMELGGEWGTGVPENPVKLPDGSQWVSSVSAASSADAEIPTEVPIAAEEVAADAPTAADVPAALELPEDDGGDDFVMVAEDTPTDPAAHRDQTSPFEMISTSNVLAEWRMRHEEELSKQEEDSRKRRAEKEEEARLALKNFYSERDDKKQKTAAENRETEKEYLIQRESDMNAENCWERVTKLIDLKEQASGNKDTNRMRQVLINLKSNPLVCSS